MKTKKSLLIAPALGVLLLAAAGSVSGTVAWFSAVRVFDTEIANFSVVETDGNLDVKMAASEGTINVRDDKIAVIDGNTNKPTSTGSFTTGDTASRPATPSDGTLYFDTTVGHMMKYNGSAWVDAELNTGKYYVDGNNWYVATSATEIESANSNRPAVLTHGSFDLATGHASTLHPDATNAAPSYLDKGVDGAGNNWLYKNAVSINTYPSGTANVDVYVAVSWEMTFKYTFAGDSTSVAIYLDSKTSNFEDVDSPTPNFKFNAGETLDTQKGFRIGFYGGYYTDDPKNAATAGDPATGAHNFVWGNNTPIQEYNSGSTYNTGDFVEYSADYYRCNTDSTTGDWASAKWDAVSEYSETDYALNAYVLHDGAVYKCSTAINDGGHAWDAKEWTATGDITTAKYIKTSPSLAPQAYTSTNYVTQTNLDRVDALAEAANAVTRPERLCVLTSTNPVVTVKCAAWYEGTDPNVVSGAAMACLKANMHFYARTVTGAL